MSKYQINKMLLTKRHFEYFGQIRGYFRLIKMFYQQIMSKIQKDKKKFLNNISIITKKKLVVSTSLDEKYELI